MRSVLLAAVIEARKLLDQDTVDTSAYKSAVVNVQTQVAQWPMREETLTRMIGNLISNR